MTDIDLAFISRQLERVLAEQASMRAEQAGIRDEMLVLGARIDRIEATLNVILLETRSLTRAIARMNDRVEKLEAAR